MKGAMPLPLLVHLARLGAEERRALPQTRRPEPHAVMTDPDAVEAFDRQGLEILRPLYLFNVQRVSRLAPLNGKILDLGSGSGQFLRLLAEARPDLTIVGVEPSPGMRSAGQRWIEAGNFADRVRLMDGDMRQRLDDFPGPFNVITSLFALHHLTGFADLERCLAQVRRLRERDGAALWFFDHARPRGADIPQRFAALATGARSDTLERDSARSLAAAFTVDELAAAWRAAGLPPARHHRSRVLPVYQTLACAGNPPSPRSIPARTPRHVPLGDRAGAVLFGFLLTEAP